MLHLHKRPRFFNIRRRSTDRKDAPDRHLKWRLRRFDVKLPVLAGTARARLCRGQNLAIEFRFVDWQLNRLPALAAELVALRVDVIVAVATPAARAAKQATRTIPIVAVGMGDPVGDELVASLGSPGGNVTGNKLVATGDEGSSNSRANALLDPPPVWKISAMGACGDEIGIHLALAVKIGCCCQGRLTDWDIVQSLTQNNRFRPSAKSLCPSTNIVSATRHVPKSA